MRVSSLYLSWLIWRVVLPLAITAVVVYFTWGRPFFDVNSALLWTAFIAHLVVTLTFRRTHVLDTGSFVCLLPFFAAMAEISESWGNRLHTQWGTAASAFVVYALLSLVGRRRALNSDESGSTVSSGHVIAAAGLLVVAVVVCSTSKTAVGFLIVPAVIGVPLVLIYSLCKRDKNA